MTKPPPPCSFATEGAGDSTHRGKGSIINEDRSRDVS